MGACLKSRAATREASAEVNKAIKTPDKFKKAGVTDAEWQKLLHFRTLIKNNKDAYAAAHAAESEQPSPPTKPGVDGTTTEFQQYEKLQAKYETDYQAYKEKKAVLDGNSYTAKEALSNWVDITANSDAIKKIQVIHGSSVRSCPIDELEARQISSDNLYRDNIQSGYGQGYIPVGYGQGSHHSGGYYSPSYLSSNYNNEYLFMLIPSTIIIIVLFCLFCLCCLVISHGLVGAIGYFYGKKKTDNSKTNIDEFEHGPNNL